MHRKIFLGQVPYTSCFLCSHPFSAVLSHRKSQTFVFLYGVFHLAIISPDFVSFQTPNKTTPKSEDDGFDMQISSTQAMFQKQNDSAYLNLVRQISARDILLPNTHQTLCEATLLASKSATYIAVSVFSAARYEHVAAYIYIFHALSCILLQGFLVAVLPTSQDVFLILGNAVQLALDLCALHAALLGRVLAALALNGAALAGGGALGLLRTAYSTSIACAPALPVRACLLGAAAALTAACIKAEQRRAIRRGRCMVEADAGMYDAVWAALRRDAPAPLHRLAAVAARLACRPPAGSGRPPRQGLLAASARGEAPSELAGADPESPPPPLALSTAFYFVFGGSGGGSLRRMEWDLDALYVQARPAPPPPRRHRAAAHTRPPVLLSSRSPGRSPGVSEPTMCPEGFPSLPQRICAMQRPCHALSIAFLLFDRNNVVRGE